MPLIDRVLVARLRARHVHTQYRFCLRRGNNLCIEPPGYILRADERKAHVPGELAKNAALVGRGALSVLLDDVVYVRLVYKRFSNLSREALVRLHRLVSVPVLARLRVTDTSPVEVRTVEHADRVPSPPGQLSHEE